METERYPTDPTEEEWQVVRPLFSKSEKRGKTPVHDLRRVLDGCFHVLRGGIAWLMMPHDLPPWRIVYDHFAVWRRTGKWERVNAALREHWRKKTGRNPQPSAASIDSQSVKTTGMGGPRGYDGGKKVSGRKRQVLVDTEGTVLKAKLQPADIHDRVGGLLLPSWLHVLLPRIILVWADTHYQGLRGWAAVHLGWRIEIVKHWWTGVHGVRVAPGQDRRRSRQVFTSFPGGGWSNGHSPGWDGTGDWPRTMSGYLKRARLLFTWR